MADKLIGSLLYDDHPIPKKRRALAERLKVPVAIGVVLLVIGVLAYKFANYREERVVTQFIELLSTGQFDAAFARWDAGGSYAMKDFLEDWGQNGYYGKGLAHSRIMDSNGKGGAVIVYLALDTFSSPLAIMVDKETLKLSFSPVNKYK